MDQGMTREQTETALREREAELARVQRIGQVGGFEIDLRGGRFRNRRSPEYLLVHGLPDDAASETHEDWVGRLHPEDRDRAEGHFKATVASGARDYASEYRIVVPGGGVRWIAAMGEIERNDAGEPLRMIGVHIDITRTKRAETALRDVLEAVGEAFFLVDVEERLTNVSRLALEMWGKRAEEVLGRRVVDLFPGVEASESYQALRESVRTRAPSRVEAQSLSLHGRWVEQDVYPTADGGAAVAFRDIHARKETDLALRRSEERFRAAVAAVSGIVWTTDADGRMEGEQAGWAALTGQSQAEYQGLGWARALHPDDVEPTLEAWSAVVAQARTFVFEHRVRGRGGQCRLFSVRAVPVRDADGSVREWVGVHTDITRDRQVRDELRRLNEDLGARVHAEVEAREAAQAQLDQAQRMEALGQLAGGIAHDFNNILQVVQGGAALIGRRAKDPEAVLRLVDMVRGATERGSSITRRLLAFSRRGELRAEPVDPADLLSGLREILDHTLGAGIGITVEVSPDTPLLLADKGQLETVLVNLATNARDAMPSGGRIGMSAALDQVSEGDPRGYLGELPPGPYVCLSVRDTGSGMDAATLAHAAEPFFSTKPVGKGTGLGLAMARGFAKHSGGALHIDSAVGRGTVVQIWLPVSTRAPSMPTALAGTETMPVSGTMRPFARILLTEDDPLVRETLIGELEAAGCWVLAAGDGPSALALLDAGATVDLLVSDLSMPGIDGVTLISEVQKRRPSLPAILLTGYATEAAGLAMSSAVDGVFSLLRKPVSGAELIERIAILLAGRP